MKMIKILLIIEEEDEKKFSMADIVGLKDDSTNEQFLTDEEH